MGVLGHTQSPDVGRADRKLVGRTEPARNLEVVAAEGSHVRDARGRTFIDFQMGWCVGNLGWNPPEILARVKSFKGPSYVAPQSTYAPWSELARRLVDVTPGDLGRAYRCVGGSEAVELALQLAIAHTGRHKLVSLEDAYHGNTIGARGVGSLEFEVREIRRAGLRYQPRDTLAEIRGQGRIRTREQYDFAVDMIGELEPNAASEVSRHEPRPQLRSWRTPARGARGHEPEQRAAICANSLVRSAPNFDDVE
jgi:adenosylmethionine-8-amino-7-oxononanoate aminotransferase